MRSRKGSMCLLAGVVFFLSACASSDQTTANNVRYPPTERVETIFQISQASASCRVFAHLFATMPAGMTATDFAERITEEAKTRGADVMLIGQSRQCTTESSLNFSYCGPEHEYAVREWSGWRFGLDEWGEQGIWAAIGYDDWSKSDLQYDFPIIMQVAFLRCR